MSVGLVARTTIPGHLGVAGPILPASGVPR
jgi:hypothetical protein